MPRLEILYEDNHLLAINKPVGLATQGAGPGEPSLLAEAKALIKAREQKPGNVYLGVVSRLDAAVSGVVLLARTSKAAARLTNLFRTREVRKLYWAVVEGLAPPGPVECHDWLAKDDARHRMYLARPTDAGAQEARLRFRRMRVLGDNSLVEVTLETGRKHQIRVQLAGRRHPVLGDRKYGARQAFPAGIALHARQLELIHPVRKVPILLTAPVPATWRRWGVTDVSSPG